MYHTIIALTFKLSRMLHAKHFFQFGITVLFLITASCSNNSDDSGLGDSDLPEDTTTLQVDTNSLATIGCQNVIILNGFAYASCGNGIEIINLSSLERNFINSAADDITGDAELGVFFTQSGTELRMFGLADPMEPNTIASVTTNFAIFSGVSAANGILVVSAGSGGSDTEVYTYTDTTLSLAIDGIPTVDNRTGNPDVHVAATPEGAIAFYSEDIGAVANWGIQIVEFDESGSITNIPSLVTLTAGQFTGAFGRPFGPANFPTESEFLNNVLYTAHFAAEGIHVIDLLADNELSLIPLGYEPINIATDGELLYVIALNRNQVAIVDPATETIAEQITLPLEQANGIAASTTHIAIADRNIGLIVLTR